MSGEIIRTRIETLCRERGLKWVEIYKQLDWNKSFASMVLNGKFIPPLWQRVDLAKAFGVDASVIWDEPLLLEYYQTRKREGRE